MYLTYSYAIPKNNFKFGFIALILTNIELGYYTEI